MKQSEVRSGSLGVTVALASALALSPSPTRATDAVEANALDEVIVTARKRQESLQEVPFSITAFDQVALERRQIESLRDVAQFTAGFSFEDYASTALETPVIRGQTQAFLTNPIQNVATFVDGIYLQRGYMIDVGLVDVERIEVLKGPQSSLYGQNAFSGAISYVTARPSKEYEASIRGTIGTDERYEARGSISGPLFGDWLVFRLGAGLSRYDGSWKNNHPLADAKVSPGTRGNVGGHDNWAVHGALLFEPIEKLTVEAGYYRTEIDAEVSPQYSLIGQRAIGQFRFSLVNDLNCSPTVQFGTLGNNLWCGPLPSRPENVPGAGVNRSAAEPVIDPRSYGQKGKNEVTRASARYEILESLAASYLFGRAESDVTSGRQSTRDPIVGLPQGATFGLGSGLVLFDSVPNGALEAESHELRVEYEPFDALTLSLGGYSYESTDYASSRTYYLPPLQARPLTEFRPLLAANYTILDDSVTAVYGSLEYGAGPWTFTAEARRTQEKKRRYTAADPINGGPQFAGTLPALPANPDLAPREFSFVTPRFSVRRSLRAGSIVYVTAARGAKAGGFNRRTVLPQEQSYEPEFNWTYELGTKNDLLEGRLRLNASVFYIDWTGMQISGTETNGAPTAPAIIRNLGAVKTLGFEVESGWRPVEGLDVTLALSHVDPTLKKGTRYLEPVTANWCAPTVCDPNGDIGGKTLPRTPKTKATLGASWLRPLTPSLDYFVRTDVSYQSKQFLEFLNVGWVPSRTLTNASVGVAAESWDVQLWVKNAFDKEYASSSLFGGSFVYGVAFGELRTAGLTASYRF